MLQVTKLSAFKTEQQKRSLKIRNANAGSNSSDRRRLGLISLEALQELPFSTCLYIEDSWHLRVLKTQLFITRLFHLFSRINKLPSIQAITLLLCTVMGVCGLSKVTATLTCQSMDRSKTGVSQSIQNMIRNKSILSYKRLI